MAEFASEMEEAARLAEFVVHMLMGVASSPTVAIATLNTAMLSMARIDPTLAPAVRRSALAVRVRLGDLPPDEERACREHLKARGAVRE